MTGHLGYEKHDPAGRGSGNSRNGMTPKTVLTDVGAVDLAVPRDRNGTFEPQIVRKGQTRLEGFNERIIALYARGMTTRDIRAHLREMYDIDVSPDLISRVTDAVVEELQEWQARPLEPSTPSSSLTPSCATRRCVSEWRWETCTAWPSQRLGEAEGSLIRGTPGRAGSSPDNDGTCQYCQMVRVRLARREGVLTGTSADVP
jgi:hypothetical protein